MARKQACDADISYLFADIKFDGENLKILELGEGKNGGYDSYDGVFEVGRIWANFWDWLFKLNIPVWYVGKEPTMMRRNKIGKSLKSRVAWDLFLSKGGYYASSLEEMERSSLFKELKDSTVTDRSSVNAYKAILVYKAPDNVSKNKLKKLEMFKKRNPTVLILDTVSRPFGMHKYLNHLLFTVDDSLSSFRPTCFVYPKQYSQELVQTIRRDLSSSYLVIKPLNSARSNGIIICDRDNLDAILQQILMYSEVNTYSSKHHLFSHRPSNTVTYNYWLYDRNDHFMVEEYCSSKTLMVGSKPYDPTLRVVFVLKHDKGRVDISFLEWWWKVPAFDLNAPVSLTQKHVSHYDPKFLSSLPSASLRLTQKEADKMKNLVERAMKEAYLKMIDLYAYTHQNIQTVS